MLFIIPRQISLYAASALLSEKERCNKQFNHKKYKEDGAYRRQVKAFKKLFPSFTAVVATKEFKLLGMKADNILYNEDNVFPMTKLLTEVTQHEGRSNNLSQRQ